MRVVLARAIFLALAGWLLSVSAFAQSETTLGGANSVFPGMGAAVARSVTQGSHSIIARGSQTLDTYFPVQTPQTGNYTIRWSGNGGATLTGSDDFSTIPYNSSSPGTFTMPASTTQVFPAGHGICVKNLGAGELTVAPTGPSTFYGAAGVVNGSPAALGGKIYMFQGGEACLQADASGNYMVSGYAPGVAYQFANNVASLLWTGLNGFPEYRLHCSGVVPVTNGDQVFLQLAYGGTFQASGYTTTGWFLPVGGTFQSFTATNQSGLLVTGSTSSNNNYGASFDVTLTFSFGTGSSYANNVYSTAFYYDTGQTALTNRATAGYGPLTTTQPVTGIQLYTTTGNIASGMCWLEPKL